LLKHTYSAIKTHVTINWTAVYCNYKYVYPALVLSASTFSTHSLQSLLAYGALEAALVVDYPVCYQSIHGIHPLVAHSTDLTYLGWKVGIRRKGRDGGWKEERGGKRE